MWLRCRGSFFARWCVRPGGQKTQGFLRSRLPIAPSHVPAVNNPFETPIPIIAEGIDLAAVQGSFLGVCDEVRAGEALSPEGGVSLWKAAAAGLAVLGAGRAMGLRIEEIDLGLKHAAGRAAGSVG